MRVQRAHWAVQALVLAFLGACAGGGGAGGGGLSPPVIPPSPPTPRPPAAPVPPLPPPAAVGTTPDLTSAEYTNNWGVAGTGAQYAWAYENGHGEGVLIGVIDDGVDPNHPELVGRIDPDSRDINATRNALTTTLSHGSELSSLIAGNHNGAGTVGIAYEASILAVRADSGTGSFNYRDLANAVDYAVAQGVDVINFSLGSPGAPTSEDGIAFRNAIANATAAGVIIVASAGNEGSFAPQPNYPGMFATDPNVGRGLMIIAGGSNRDGSFNTVSNRAGSAAQHYIVAPGWEIIVPDYGPPGVVEGFQRCWPDRAACNGFVEIQGTSYASPQTAGAVAILMSAFPGLSPQQVVQLLLQTSDDMAESGIDSVTGWGSLNLRRAFAPVGTLSTPLMAGMHSVTPTTALGMAGPAFGDGLSDDAGEWQTVGFDAFERTFQVDLTNNWMRAPSAAALGARAPTLWRQERAANGATMMFAPADSIAPESVRLPVAREDLERAAVRIDTSLPAGFTFSFAANGADTARGDVQEPAGHLAFVNSDVSLRLTHNLGDHMRVSLMSESGEARVGLMQEHAGREATAAQAAFDFGGFGFTTTFGEISEKQGLLGLVWTDALGDTPRGQLEFAGLGGHVMLAPALRWSFEAETGRAELGNAGWLDVGEPLRTTSFSTELNYFGDGLGVWMLTLSQPMRVESGNILVRLPDATAYGRRSMRYETRAIDPTPSGREMRLGLGYRYFEGESFSAFGEVLHITDPGHVAAAEDDTVLRVGLRMRR